jgi:uncharacterized protein YbjT (DUF2867 family)
MENCAWDIEPARKQGKLYSYLHPLDRPFPLVATQDVGEAGADALLQSWSGHRHIEVAGPRRYSPGDIANDLSSVIGRSVQPVEVPRDEWVKSFVAQGTPEERTALRVEMLDGFNSGWIDFGVPDAERVNGQTKLQSVLESLIAKGGLGDRREGKAS